MADVASFEGKVAAITGAGQGVGEATARLFAAREVTGLALCDRDQGKLERVAGELTAAGCPTEPIRADLAEVDQADRGSIDDMSVESFDLIFAINARAPFFLIQRALPHMRKAGGGAIVNVTSIVAHGGPPFITAYCGAKAALAVMTKNIANAVRFDRVRVNALNMGWTATPGEHVTQMRWHGRSENWLAEVDREQPFGRLLRAEDIARAIAFLASDESALMTGAVVDFDQTVIGVYPDYNRKA